MKIRGITCGNTRKVVEAALEDPRWTYDGVSRAGHGMLRWLPTGEVLFFGLTPSDRNSWKNTARDIERLSGIEVWHRGNSKPGRVVRALGVPLSKRQLREKERICAEMEAKAQAARKAAQLERARRDAADRAADADRRRREIQSLMRPGRVVL